MKMFCVWINLTTLLTSLKLYVYGSTGFDLNNKLILLEDIYLEINIIYKYIYILS